MLDNGQALNKNTSCGSILESDGYLYPNLLFVGGGENNRRIYTNSVRLLMSEVSAEGVLVEGDKKSGRTGLLFQLFRKYHACGYIPVLIRGRDLKKPSPSDLDLLIKRAIEYQYCDGGIEAFAQCRYYQKLLLIDDYDYSPLAYSRVLDRLREHFGLLVVTVGRMFITRSKMDFGISIESLGLKHYKLLPLSHV